MIEIVPREEVLVEDVVSGCFVAEPGTEVIGELQDVPRAASRKHLAKFNTEVLLPLILAYYYNKVVVPVLLYYLGHVVRYIEVLIPWNACIEEPAVRDAKIPSVEYYHVKSHIESVVK